MIADGATTSTITVTLKDAQSNPVSGKTVTLAKGGGSSTITTVSGTTNGSGVATFTVKDTVGEADHLHGDRHHRRRHGHPDRGRHLHGRGRSTAAQSTVCGGTGLGDGQRRHDLDGDRHTEGRQLEPGLGQDVTLAKGGGSSTITTVSGVTNGSGQATFTVKDTVAEATTYTATDTTDSITVTQTATVTFTPGAATAAQSTVSAAPASVTADGNSTTSTVTVTLRDAQSNLSRVRR